jgi:polyketide cyclase/dehydrase/lipid transport protein
VRLRRQEIVINAAPELCFEVVAAAGRRLEKRSDTEWVVEYSTQAGNREVRTVELLTLERPRAIRYRWLEGPLPKVSETIRFYPENRDRTKLTYTGTFSVGKGPLGWFIGLFWVKPLFERVVREHLKQAKQIAEKRAERSHVHSRAGHAEREEPQ